ncbi:uncharacterized protein LOC110067033 isoform X3 [Orbicella faveolata]|uniref:uncharacterized protein LOC110067033 isoform X3 n=1 Tax=Orbicella faveolata TaxID=48498 RepID=UPI0009E61769|nr:uncharacterized protein LOC110067033 isoform X3 [Orbicella faveolata]
MSRSPTYVGRLDPQFRRFVNVLSVYPTSPTSSLQSLIDDKDEAATSLASSSCSGEKFPEFLTVDAYTDETWPEAQGQREVSELFLEYVNVLSSGSESSLMTDDKEIATSTATSRRRKNPQNGSYSGQHSSQEIIPDDSIVEDSVFESDACSESFYDENYCLQKRPGVSNKTHHFNRPVSGSFSSEADSERNHTDRNEAVVSLKDSGGFGRLPGAGAYSRRKENISSVPRLRGQEVISKGPQDTSRHMDVSLDDSYSVDSELCYSSDIIEDDCSSTSSADSSFVCFALVGEQEDAKTKRKIASNVGRRDRHKMHRSRDSSRRGEPDGKERDHGVMACVVTGISGGPAVRVYRDDDLKKSAARPKLKRSEIEYLREANASSDGKEFEADTADKDVSKGSQFPLVRSKGRSRGFVFGVFGTPENPALEEEKSTSVDVNALNPESGASSGDVENIGAYRNRLPMLPGSDFKSKPSVDVDDKRIYERSNDLLAIECDIPTDNMVVKSKATEKALIGSSREERIDDISIGKPSPSPEEIFRSSPSHCNDEPKSLPSRGRLNHMVDVNEDDKRLPSSKSVTEGEDKEQAVPLQKHSSGFIEGEDKEQAVPLQKHSSGFIERKRDVRVKAISKSVQNRRPRRKRKEDEQHRKEHDKVKPRDEKKLPDETDPVDSQNEHDLKNVTDCSAPDREVKMTKLSPPWDSANRLGIDSHRGKQDSKATGYLEPGTGNLRDETLLMTDEVQRNISDGYTAAEFKTDLLTPVKQTIRESIEAGFVDNGTSGEELKTRLKEDDQVCPESWSCGVFGTQLEGHKQQQPHKDQSLAMEIAEGLQSMSGDFVMKEDLPVYDSAIGHSQIISKKDYSVSILENQRENNLAMKNNSGSSQNRNTDYGYFFHDVESEPKDNESCDPIVHDMNDFSDDHDRAFSVHDAHFVLNSLSESRKNDDVSLMAGIQGISTDDSVETVNTCKPGSTTDQEREVRDTNPESQVSLRNPCQPMEQSIADHHGENEEESLSQLSEDEAVSQIYGSAHKKRTPEAKRKNPEDQKQQAKYSKKMRNLLEASQKDGNFRSHSNDKFSGYSGTEKLFSTKEAFKIREESSGKAVELPVRSLGEGQPSIKETHAFTSKEESNTKPSEVDASRGRAIESGHSSTMDSMETTKTVEMFTPDVTPIVITAQAYVLINNGTKNISYVPEFDGSHDVAPTAAQEATKYESQGLATPEISGHDDFSFSGLSSERFADESLEVRANVYQSSLSTPPCSKSSSHPDIDEVVGEKTASKVEGEVQRTNLIDKNKIASGDDPKWIHLPSKEEDQCLSIPSVEKVEKENLELIKRDRNKGTKMDPPMSGGSAAGLYDTLDVSVEEINVLVNKPESLDGHSESLDNEEIIQIPTKQPSAITILPDAQRPQKVSEILLIRSRNDSCKDTAGKCDKSLHPLAETIETLPSVSAHRQDKDNNGLTPSPGGPETSNEELCVNEDVCFVDLDASEHSQDGTRGTVELMSDEADLCSTKPDSVSNELTDEENAFPVESDLDLREGVSRKMNVTDNVLISDEGEKRHHEVEEAVCSYQEPEECLSQNEWNSLNLINGVRNTDAENSTKIERDAKTDVWHLISLPDGTTQAEVGEMSKPGGGMRELYVHVSETHVGETFTGACLEETVFELSDRDGFPLGSKTVNNDVPDWIPCNQLTHCGCLHRYLHQRSQEKESDGNQESAVFSASLQKLDTQPSLEGAEDAEMLSTFKVNGYHANPSVQEVFDQQCQVELLKECMQPEYNTKESQTSFSSSVMNKECQTNESTDMDIQPEALQQQSIECRTELPPNFYTSCGVQVEWENIQRNSQSLCADQDCQTDYELILTSSEQCQTLSCTEDSSRFSVDHRNANLHGAEESYKVSFENKECQTSENYLFSNPSSELSSKKVGSSDFLPLANKECQTSRDILLATSSTQCNILPSRGVEEALISEKAKPLRLPSCESKECQTLLDEDMILATSKHCQTSSWPRAPEETPVDRTNVGDEGGILYESKECQTLSNSSLPLLLSKECQTLAEFASDIPNTLKGFKAHPIVAYNSKESQATPDPMNDLDHPSFEPFEGIEVEFSVQSTQTEDTSERVTPPPSHNKESQTTPDQDLLLSSSKVCQTTELKPVTIYENRESQTLPDGEMFLITSKECQTMPHHLDDLGSELPNDRSEDMDLSNDANAEVYSEICTSPQMTSRLRPATYGKSPETIEKSFFEFQAEFFQTNIELDPRPVVSSLTVDVSEKGCQTMLCNCSSCADESNFASVSRDTQKGAAMRVSEGMQKEQASLIKQLDMLRDMNQKLRDDKDAIEAAHEAKKTKVSRQGSQMSKYVKKRRAPPAEETWGNQGSVESFSGEEVDGPNNRSDGTRSRRRSSKRRDMKKQGSVMYSYLSNNSQGSVTLHDSIQEEAEFDGDPTLEIISDEKLKELEQPAWAKKILSCVQPKEIAKEEEEEEEEEDQIGTSDEELEEDVFRKRKAELTSGAARSRLKAGENESDMSYSEGLSGETGSETDDRPNSPRAAPVGKDNEMCRTVSQDMSEACASTISEPATPERVFKVVFVGDSGVGKSSFIHRFCHDAWKPSFTATIGVDFQIKTMCIDSRCIALQLWDTAGQERFRSITKQYFRKADGVIVFYDVTMETSFLNIKNWMISVEEGTDDGTAVMIVGNKTDLVEDDSERAVKSQDGKKLAEEYKALYTETSAKTGYNIQESMAEFSKMLQVREDELMQSVLNLVHEPQPKKKCCK